MKKTVVFALLLSLMLSLAGCACEHEWSQPDCVNAAACAKCGETEGEPLGHSWADATCTDAKRCSVCGETQGEPLGHTPGQWQERTDCIAALTEKTRECTVCGRQTDLETAPVTTLLSEGAFLFTPEEFMARFTAAAGNMGLEMSYAFAAADTGLMTVVSCGGNQAFVQFFRSGAVSFTAEETDSTGVWCVSFIAIGESDALLRRSFFMAGDPLLDADAAFDLDVTLSTAFLNAAAGGEIFGYHTENDLLYESCYVAEGTLGQSYAMTVSNIYASDFR